MVHHMVEKEMIHRSAASTCSLPVLPRDALVRLSRGVLPVLTWFITAAGSRHHGSRQQAAGSRQQAAGSRQQGGGRIVPNPIGLFKIMGAGIFIFGTSLGNRIRNEELKTCKIQRGQDLHFVKSFCPRSYRAVQNHRPWKFDFCDSNRDSQ